MSEAGASGGFDALARELEERFGRGVEAPWPDFGEVAARVFRVQYEHNPVYRALCDVRGVRPDGLAHWRDAPLVPATAFKHLELVVGRPEEAELLFRTSGTTRGAEARGRHLVPRASLYRASLLPPVRAWLVPEGSRLPVVSLLPPPEAAPHSSLSWMMGAVADALGDPVVWGADADGAPDPGRLDRAFEARVAEGRPVLVAGTAFAFVHYLDALAERGRRWSLPEGSRVMETGGFKGRSRVVSRGELYDGIHRALGVPPHRIVNEYGMTELLSQLYEPVLRTGADGDRPGHRPPPWLAVRALDPVTLEERPEGRSGILAFHDLANAGSVASILTQDVGAVRDGAVHLEGRLPGAEPRGCSLALEELLRAAGDAG